MPAGYGGQVAEHTATSEAAAAPRKRVRMDTEARRRIILQAAAGQFRDRPYSQVSISDIAEAAGVARGLLHHYFGSKRELYLAVVRDVARVPVVEQEATEATSVGPDPSGADTTAPGSEGSEDDVWTRSVDGLLGLIGANSERWLTAVTVGGAERDDEVAQILDAGREVVAEQTIRALGIDPDTATAELWAVVRGYGGFVQELTVEWLERGRLTRDQVRAAMVRTLPLLLAEILPEVEAIRADRSRPDDGR